MQDTLTSTRRILREPGMQWTQMGMQCDAAASQTDVNSSDSESDMMNESDGLSIASPEELISMLTDPSQGWGALDYTWHCAARLLHDTVYNFETRPAQSEDRGVYREDGPGHRKRGMDVYLSSGGVKGSTVSPASWSRPAKGWSVDPVRTLS